MKILDFQAYVLNRKKIVPKELAIFDGYATSHYIFKPPVTFTSLSAHDKRQVSWLENNYHGLRWSIGWISLRDLPNILKYECLNDLVYVKGSEKKSFIQNILGHTAVVEEYPSLQPTLHRLDLKPRCFYHSYNGHCAINHVVTLYSHYCNGSSRTRNTSSGA